MKKTNKNPLKTLFALGLLVAASVALATPETATEFRPGKMAAGAPSELQHWGKLVGQWVVSGESLKQDGSGWEPSGDADWDFFWAFNGWGIQDNYTQPPLSVTLEDESKRQHGINLRIYNPVEKKWVLTWLTTASSKPSGFTAQSNDEQVVMISDTKDLRGNFNRITFFDMQENSFKWKLEWSADKEAWLEVARIHGKRKLTDKS